ncbi:MAG: hypothetical protein LUG60_09410 [Erysipelotrichaceae bacterium]|nr:hypothetical protein [Erysipelotrichaceae bacterium]
MERQFEFDLKEIKKTSLDAFCQHILEGFMEAMQDEDFLKELEEYKKTKK